MNVDELDEGQLLQINSKAGSDLYKFLGQYPDRTATVEWLFTWPRGVDSGYLPSRTQVTRLGPDQFFDFVTPSDRMVELYRGVAAGEIPQAPHHGESV